MNNRFFDQGKLVLQILPFVSPLKELALKGGTALNYFVHNFPRLSVDIDLTYLPIQSRQESLTNISALMQTLKKAIESAMPQLQVIEKVQNGGAIALRVMEESAMIKIEPNLVIRGAVFMRAESRDLVKDAEQNFGVFVSANCLSLPDLYGGKICAALDRQHPRDLFDIKLMLEGEGLTEKIRRAFLVYLISHPRPMSELPAPNDIDITSIFNNEFEGMTRVSTSLDELLNVRTALVTLIQQNLTDEERRFVLSVKRGEPDWSLFPYQHIRRLPAVQWKLLNIRKMSKNKHAHALEKLRQVLDI